MTHLLPRHRLVLAALATSLATAFPFAAHASDDAAAAVPVPAVADVARRLEVGDVVFIRIGIPPFTQVADGTGSWTNHVGVVVAVDGEEPLVAESRVPRAGTTTWSKFVGRSAGGRVAVMRLRTPLTPDQARAVRVAADARAGAWYDTGFNLHSSSRQFCSRYVREVLQEATGEEVGDVRTLRQLLAEHPQASVGFWRAWYFGFIPWDRETVTPASELASPKMAPVFDGVLQG